LKGAGKEPTYGFAKLAKEGTFDPSAYFGATSEAAMSDLLLLAQARSPVRGLFFDLAVPALVAEIRRQRRLLDPASLHKGCISRRAHEELMRSAEEDSEELRRVSEELRQIKEGEWSRAQSAEVERLRGLVRILQGELNANDGA
jgi:hypothetical protein